MAHFAKLGKGNIVEKVVVVNNDVITVDGVENEQKGKDFLNKLYGTNDVWIQTSYNGNFRKRFGQKGMYYDSVRDMFYPPQQFKSWTFDEEQGLYISPVPYPEIDPTNLENLNTYVWNEKDQVWERGF